MTTDNLFWIAVKVVVDNRFEFPCAELPDNDIGQGSGMVGSKSDADVP